MRRKGMFLGFLLLLILASGVFLISQLTIVDESFLKSDWELFQEELMAEYSIIESVDIYGNSPSLIISYTLSGEMSDKEIENVFLETRKFLFNEDMFSKFVDYHYEKSRGAINEIYISFHWGDNNNLRYLRYFSSSDTRVSEYDSFLTWDLYRDGVTTEYVEKD